MWLEKGLHREAIWGQVLNAPHLTPSGQFRLPKENPMDVFFWQKLQCYQNIIG